MDNITIVNIGVQQFDRIRERGSFYVDKTRFIKEWWESGSDVTLITRPRRFGKTLNMSMLECFFSNKYAGRGDLFEGLSVWKDEKYRQIQGTYPVIFLSFASVKTGTVEGIKTAFKRIVSNVYMENRDIMDSEEFNDDDRDNFASVNVKMDDDTAYSAINSLCMYLERHYGKKVIIILDEYDTPMQESWLSGNWDRVAAFFRLFFNSTFKTNSHIERGMITGITRISKESIFSGLNNLDVVTTTSDDYATSFGFTEEEVFKALDDMELGSEKQGVKQWYDGFTFGRHTDIYNPWSIASFIRKNGKYAAYWANTSGNGLVNSLIQQGSTEIKQIMEDLLQGKSFVARIDEQIVFNQLDGNEDAVWSLLLATGYLKVLEVEEVKEDDEKNPAYTLALTNFEVKRMFQDMVDGWFHSTTHTEYNGFIKALLINDVDYMNEFMNDIALCSFSNFDTAKSVSHKDAPERFYHGFVLGLMVELKGRFVIKSNRESGFGRYDIIMKPSDREHDCAYIIEFKVHKPKREKDLEETLSNAHKQIEEKRYEEELVSEGFAPEKIRKYGFVFRGKECLIG
ncbi:MAG: ATP-binding protein [Lachnospiraceae bacterium]|nr:ATP-binding protein [Lachnospiraceae bacterium]